MKVLGQLTTIFAMKTVKILFTTLGLLCISSGISFAQSQVQFRLSCKVMDNIIIEAEEGRSKRYTHYNDQFVVGDTLVVLVELRPNDSLYLRLLDPLRDEVIVGTVHNADAIRFWNTEMDYLAASTVGGVSNFGIDGNDAISIENPFPNNDRLTLKRYYKDDWQGLLSNNSELEAQVAVLDCRVSGRSNLAEITERLKARVVKWNE